jgi:hypothetical protein
MTINVFYILDCVAWRHGDGAGSFFVKAINDVMNMKNKLEPKNFLNILTEANRVLSQSSMKVGKYKQTATFTSYLGYKLFLHEQY